MRGGGRECGMRFPLSLHAGSGFARIGMASLLFTCAAHSGLAAAGPGLEGDHIATRQGDLIIHPIKHATFVMQWNGRTVYVDPVGGRAAFEALPSPDLVLVTDIHGDHLNGETLEAVVKPETKIVAPSAVMEKLPAPVKKQAQVLNNGQETELLGLKIEAIPMYNLTESRLKFHTKGRGNGYVVTFGDKRVYVSGDTEDIPEMRALKDIDVAFLCMNLPYTMEVEQAADAVKAFRPKVVYPYHYRGSDVEKFKRLVGDASEVRLRDWYCSSQ